MSIIRSVYQIIILFAIFSVFLPAQSVLSANNKSLAIINGQRYTKLDFEHWWQNWRDKKTAFPDRPDKFIDWYLQVQEAERMELDTLPEVKHQLDVFRKARSLMMLKYDEVDSKIDISDSEIKSMYEHDYSPARQIAVLDFADAEKAAAAVIRLNAQKSSLEDLKSMAVAENPEFKLQKPQCFRPVKIPQNWFKLLADKDVGSFVGPLPVGEKFMLLYLVDLKPASKADFAHTKKKIYDDIYAKRKRALTTALLKKLNKKFNVQINRQLLDEIDLVSPKQDNWDKILVTSTLSEVRVGYFIEQCRKEQAIIQGSKRGKARAATLKHRAMSAMISNSLVDWEAASRHYEERPPLKWEYQFYLQGRLVKLLQKRIKTVRAVSEKDARTYYNDNKDSYRSADMVKISLAHSTKDEINHLWGAGMASGDLIRAAASLHLSVAISSKQVPLAHLSEAVQLSLKQLTLNDISTPFMDGEQMSLVQLYDRQKGSFAPFSMVRRNIMTKLKKAKNDELLSDYIEKLSGKSSVKINDALWQDIKKENRKSHEK